jgi:hypothetical protein
MYVRSGEVDIITSQHCTILQWKVTSNYGNQELDAHVLHQGEAQEDQVQPHEWRRPGRHLGVEL